ncbi:MAG: phosphatidylglycerophosphatase A [Acidobacteria bacterium]|nr:MAG: phosphatidylglycerophosphatase A [Acidobacteriota bacterium]
MWFGAGLSPVAPGTAGTAAAVPLVLLLWWAGSWPVHLATTVGITCVGLWAAGDPVKRWGVRDPGPVVVDEVAGYLAATCLVPPGPATLLASFFLFRALDVIKPWPARSLERLPGGLGIVADDLAAGLYANLLLRAGLLAWTHLG